MMVSPPRTWVVLTRQNENGPAKKDGWAWAEGEGNICEKERTWLFREVTGLKRGEEIKGESDFCWENAAHAWEAGGNGQMLRSMLDLQSWLV